MNKFIEVTKPLSAKELKLQVLANYVYRKSPYWKSVLDAQNIDISDFGMEDLQKLPVLTKGVLQKNMNEMICAAPSEIIDYVCTSGTTSSPVHIPLTNNDLERLAYNEYQSILRTGATRDDIFQICTTLDKQFMAGMAYFMGLKKLGAGVIRVGIEPLETQWKTILSIRPSYLIAVPSFIVKLIDYAKENGIDYQNCSVKKIICIGENIRDLNFELNALGSKIRKQWNVQLFSTYASTEMATSFTECLEGKGGHLNSDLLIIECLDENNKHTAPGEVGELVVTTLDIEGLPLIRYKTGDLCILHTGLCECGDIGPRISPILGRTGQRLKYKGTTLYPSAIFDVINKFQLVQDSLLTIEKDEVANDIIKIHLAVNFGASVVKLKSAVKSVVRVLPEFYLYETLTPMRKKYKVDRKRKLVKVLDFR